MSGRIENGALLLGRALLAACFIPSVMAKLSNISGFAVSLAAAGLPYPGALATLGVLVNAFGPLALLVGMIPRVTAASLIAFTAAMSVLFHRFWETGAAMRPVEQAAFIANLGMIAGLLIYFVSGPGAWSWQGWRRSLRGGEARPAPAKKRAPRVPRPA